MQVPNIKALQSLVRPEQMNAITDWNKKRNSLILDITLEKNMLAEEFGEYYDAEALVDQLDAVADVLFVGGGTVAKVAANFPSTAVNFTEALDVILSDFAGRCVSEGIEMTLVGELISEALTVVIEANQQKLTDKDADGKVKKPEGFVPPEVKLESLINTFKARVATPPPGPDGVGQVFPQEG